MSSRQQHTHSYSRIRENVGHEGVMPTPHHGDLVTTYQFSSFIHFDLILMKLQKHGQQIELCEHV